jgi:hypothetical protein
LTGETEVLGETLPQRHFVHHKSHMTRCEREPGLLRWDIISVSRDSRVGIATSYWLEDEGLEFESRWGQEFSLLHVIQTGSGVHPTFYPLGTWGSFLGVKWPGREADHSPPTSAEVKKTWVHTSTPLYAFMA